MAKSFIARFRAKSGFLLGGVKQSQSSRWGSREDAESFLAAALKNNGNNAEGEVVESNGTPEIFRHCGEIAQAVGGKCFGCGKVLTAEDAREFSAS
jgi:hypothetical protein